MQRIVNKYLLTISISDWRDAKLFSSETNWKILDALRQVGIEGLTVEEISKKTRIPKSTVYSVLSKLEAGDWVVSARRSFGWGRPTQEVMQRFSGKPANIYIENVNWGQILFDEDFLNSLEPILEKYKEKIKKHWLGVLENIVMEYKTDVKLKKFFPKDDIHEECGRSHEAFEFLTAVSFSLTGELLEDADFEKLARRHKFMK